MTRKAFLALLNIAAVNAFVTELSCSSDMCVPQTVQYHCETNKTTLMWMQGSVQLGGYSIDSYLLTKDGYYVTVVFKDDGGISSNISFMAEGNNGTTIECIGAITEVNIITYSCLLTIPPIPVAKDLMFTVLNGTSVSLHWTSPPTTAPHCTSVYTVQVNLTENDTIDQTKHTDQPAVNISSLTMNTNYSYRVAGVDNAGRMGEWSDKQCFHLKDPNSSSATTHTPTTAPETAENTTSSNLQQTLALSIGGATPILILIIVIVVLLILILQRNLSRRKPAFTSTHMDNGSYTQTEMDEAHNRARMDSESSMLQEEVRYVPPPSLPKEQKSNETCEESNFRPMPPPPPEEEATYSQLSRPDKKPQFLPAPEGAYSELKTFTSADTAKATLAARQRNPNEVVYAELGRKPKDAPIPLPFELNPVIYMEVQKPQATPASNQGQTKDADLLIPSNGTPPPALPQKPKVPPPPSTTPSQGQTVYADLQITSSGGSPPVLPPKPCIYSTIQQ